MKYSWEQRCQILGDFLAAELAVKKAPLKPEHRFVASILQNLNSKKADENTLSEMQARHEQLIQQFTHPSHPFCERFLAARQEIQAALKNHPSLLGGVTSNGNIQYYEDILSNPLDIPKNPSLSDHRYKIKLPAPWECRLEMWTTYLASIMHFNAIKADHSSPLAAYALHIVNRLGGHTTSLDDICLSVAKVRSITKPIQENPDEYPPFLRTEYNNYASLLSGVKKVLSESPDIIGGVKMPNGSIQYFTEAIHPIPPQLGVVQGNAKAPEKLKKKPKLY